MGMSVFWMWLNSATAIAATALPTLMPKPPWPARCAAMDSSHLWWSVSARRRTRFSTVSSVWPPHGRWASISSAPRLLEVDERAAKAAIHGLNDTGRRPHEWEEAWIFHALVREDGMTQVEVAEPLGRHKSWVCRRLALVEKLAGKRARFTPGVAFGSGRKVAGAVAHGQSGAVLATLHRDD